MIYTISSFYYAGQPTTTVPECRIWVVRAIPLPFYGGYIKAAWAVLTGRAVALRYPMAGELEQALAGEEKR